MSYKKIFITCTILLFVAGFVHAQNVIRPKIQGPNGLMVNSYNGVLFFGRTDLETQNSKMPMQARFYYNSSSNDENVGYGLGFSLGLEMSYSENEIGSIIIKSGDGRSDTYAKYGNDYQAPAGVFSSLKQYEFGKFVLTEKNGDKYYFDEVEHKKITSIVDRYGNITSFTYRDNMLQSVQDAAGHTLTFTYTDGLLTSLRASFHDGAILYEYDGLRRLKKRTDAMGNSTSYNYNNQNRICQIIDAEGHTTKIAYNSSSMVCRLKTEVSDKSIRYDGDKTVFIDYTVPQNQYSYYRWDEHGRVIEKVGLCCGIQSTLVYDDDDNVIKRTDANGHVTTYTYDEHGNMLSMTDALGKKETYTYESQFNQVASFVDKNGNTYRFIYNQQGNLTTIEGPLGFRNTYTYDSHGWQLTATDAMGNVTMYSYNPDGTTASVMDAAGNTTHYTYDQYENLLSVQDARGNTTSYTYDKNHLLLSQRDPLGHTSTLSYDRVGNIVRVKNAKNQITAYTFDALGNVLTETDPSGGVRTFIYDGKGNVIQIVDPMGGVVTQTWDDHNHLLSQTNEENETTSYEYDAKGNLISIFYPNGNVETYTYDILDRVIREEDNMGVLATYTYDNVGNNLTASDGLNHTIYFSYDALNRVVEQKLPTQATSSYQYDLNGNLLCITDELGHRTSYTYDALNRVLTHTDANNATTTMIYDAVGNIVRQTDANNNSTVYTYDALNQMTTASFANSANQQYMYDELGHVTRYTDRAGQVFNFTYNALGDLIQKSYPDNTRDSYTYDANHRMVSAVNNVANVAFAYDRTGRLVSETLNGHTTRYMYNVAEGKRTYTYPSGMSIVEHLNARDQITSILQNGNEVAAMSYNVAGQKIMQNYANGINTQFTYNSNGWLESIQGDNMLNLSFTYDAVGNIIQKSNGLSPARSESYGYDAIGQITSFTRNGLIDSYAYDLLGNRVRTQLGGVSLTYSVNNINAYTIIAGNANVNPTYDSNSNLLTDGVHSYLYDYNNRLATLDSAQASYQYDALGRRISKTVSSVTTNYYYAGIQMVEEVSNGVTSSYIYGNNIDEILLMHKENTSYYYHTDQLGSVLSISDSFGNLVESISYNAFGSPSFILANGDSANFSSIDNTILFAGREYDYESGTYYCRTRSMHPYFGRFMQKDLKGYIDGMNDYLYTNNSPTNFIDNLGTKRNPVLDFLFGGCLDLPKNMRCADNGWQKAGAIALCGMDLAGFIPGAGTIAKGAKGAKMLGKGVSAAGKNMGKNGLNKLGDLASHPSRLGPKNPFSPGPTPKFEPTPNNPFSPKANPVSPGPTPKFEPTPNNPFSPKAPPKQTPQPTPAQEPSPNRLDYMHDKATNNDVPHVLDIKG